MQETNAHLASRTLLASKSSQSVFLSVLGPMSFASTSLCAGSYIDTHLCGVYAYLFVCVCGCVCLCLCVGVCARALMLYVHDSSWSQPTTA